MIPVLPAAHSKRPRSTPPGALGVGGGATLRAIDHANLWHELAWEPEQAAADARRAVARVRRALEVGHAAVTRGAE